MTSDENPGGPADANAVAVRRWDAIPQTDIDTLDAFDEEGGFAKRHLVNADLFRLLGDVRGRRVLDAGCGHGYLSRQLADRGARVVGVEPARPLIGLARRRSAERGDGVTYVEARLDALPDLETLGGPFDVVVCSMVLMSIPDWRPALRACLDALVPGGRLVFGLVHPCFEQLGPAWQEHGAYRVSEYLAEYEIPGRHGTDFHRPLSAYLNEVARLGGRVREIAEPGLDPAVAGTDPDRQAYVHLPNFLVVAVDAPS